ncbi:MAG: ATP-binding protein [Verrucomicrobiota bacterium]|nr:ATP-binding protein [Verrucomicrobiota bacterium]
MEIWDSLLSQLSQEWGQNTVKRWLAPLKLLRFDAANIYLEAEDAFQMHWIKEHLQKRLRETPLRNANGRKMELHFSLPTPAKSPEESALLSKQSEHQSIHQESTFAHFLPSSANAHLLDLLQNIETASFNPIYLYGPASSGKTHLLEATAALLRSKGKRVYYQRTEEFTERVIQAMRTGQMRALRTTLRSCDALILDDIDALARKFATQEEFFHTFNTLHMHRHPLLFASRLSPSKLEEVEARLISRFEWGITLEVHPVAPAALLEQKARLWNLSLHSDLIPWLIQTFPTSSVVALTALALRGKGTSLDPSSAASLVQDLIEKEQGNAWNEEKIMRAVAERFGIPLKDLLHKSKAREIVLPRQVAIYLFREKLKQPLQQIGRYFGKDHSTVLSSIAKVKEQLAASEDLSSWLNATFGRLGSATSAGDMLTP